MSGPGMILTPSPLGHLWSLHGGSLA
jgi:hypothetical protein